MAEVWEFHHSQWCYSIGGRVSSGVYVTREKAEAASRKPQHFSKRTFATRPVYRWLHFLWASNQLSPRYRGAGHTGQIPR